MQIFMMITGGSIVVLATIVLFYPQLVLKFYLKKFEGIEVKGKKSKRHYKAEVSRRIKMTRIIALLWLVSGFFMMAMRIQ